METAPLGSQWQGEKPVVTVVTSDPEAGTSRKPVLGDGVMRAGQK